MFFVQWCLLSPVLSESANTRHACVHTCFVNDMHIAGVCVGACVREAHECENVCMCTNTPMYTCILSHRAPPSHTCIRVHLHRYTPVCICIYTCIHKNTCMYTQACPKLVLHIQRKHRVRNKHHQNKKHMNIFGSLQKQVNLENLHFGSRRFNGLNTAKGCQGGHYIQAQWP